MKWFKNVNTIEELKKEYRKLCKQYHPDLTGGSDKAIKEINTEYERVFEILKNTTSREQTKGHKVNDGFREVIMKIINLEDIRIEVCGSWIWLWDEVKGATFRQKEIIKEAGFNWASRKKAWTWHAPEDSTFNKKSMPMDYIRLKYGSEQIEVVKQEKLYITGSKTKKSRGKKASK